jgi:mono/diheme cytochrome c family protein
MTHHVLRRGTALLAGVALVSLAVAGGCKKEDTGATYSNEGVAKVPPKTGGAKMPSQGDVVFNSAGCGKCHSTHGDSAGGKQKGPDLSKAGDDPKHTREWLTAFVRNPKAENPESKMPPFDQSKLSDEDLGKIVNYLMGLK